MTGKVHPRVLDSGLNVLDTEATHIYICSAEPMTYAQATRLLADNAIVPAQAVVSGGLFSVPQITIALEVL